MLLLKFTRMESSFDFDAANRREDETVVGGAAVLAAVVAFGKAAVREVFGKVALDTFRVLPWRTLRAVRVSLFTRDTLRDDAGFSDAAPASSNVRMCTGS